MSWLTPDQGIDKELKLDLYLRASLSTIDNIFQMTRRFVNTFERPLGTSSGQNTVWHGYAPYNPALVEKYQVIFRVVNNFLTVGKDGATPAMRLGFVKEPLSYADILWLGQTIPKPKRTRRNGTPCTHIHIEDERLA